MFDTLSDKLDAVFKKLRGHGRLTEQHVKETMREIRLVLLEADVNFRVVKDFVSRVGERATGQDVLKSLTPAQQVIKVVREELAVLMGEGEDNSLQLAAKPPVPLMLCGLQGAGKTTTCGKLALKLRRDKRNPLLVPADIYRPAAIEQLKTLGRQLDIEVFDSQPGQDPVDICNRARQYAELNGFDTIILDTAGRLHIDNQLMDELKRIVANVAPQEILFVADAMTGQDAVTVAASFDEQLPLTGVVLTKLDGDARGGAALSIRAVTGKPIKLVGMGEKLDALEQFHPDRMAQRILGMGDVLSLIEKAQAAVELEDAAVMEQKLRKEGFTLETFLEQMQMIKKMGSIDSLLKMIPGAGKAMKQAQGMQMPEQELKKIEAIIRSMTPKERLDHRILNGSRRNPGSGCQLVAEAFHRSAEDDEKDAEDGPQGAQGDARPWWSATVLIPRIEKSFRYS